MQKITKKRNLVLDLMLNNYNDFEAAIKNNELHKNNFLNEFETEQKLLQDLFDKKSEIINNHKNIELNNGKSFIEKLICKFKLIYYKNSFVYKIINVDKYFKLFSLKIETFYKVRNIDILTNLACQNSVDCSKKLNNKSYDRSELLDIKKDYDFYNNKFHKLIKERSRLAFSFGENRLKNGFIYFKLFLLEIKTQIFIFKNYE